MYNNVTAADIAALQAICGVEDVIWGDAINPDYAHDELGGISRMPEVLVRVRSTGEVSAIMKLAWQRHGTGGCGSSPPWGNSAGNHQKEQNPLSG